KYQNKIKKIDKELNLYQKDYLILNKELRHYKNLEKIFNNKIVGIAKELDLKKQILIENKIYSFKKSSLMIEEQQLQLFLFLPDEFDLFLLVLFFSCHHFFVSILEA
ncbi:hypothetical protein ACOES3_03415, partial [Candidatus Phytoplasma citri]